MKRGLLLLVALSTAACGGETSSSGDSGAGDAQAQGAADGGDGGSSGSITFQRDTTTQQASAFALFYKAAQQAAPGCTTQGSSGSCTLSECPAVVSGPYASAGTVTVSFGSQAPFALTQVSSGAYTSTPAASFAKGDVLGVSASGGDIPAFPEQSITAPGALVFGSPQAPFVISTTADLNVTWSGGEPGAQAFVGVMVSGNTQLAVSCTFDATLGAGTVPASLLSPLKAAQGTPMVSLGQMRHTTFDAGGLLIDLGAIQSMQQSATLQ